MPTGQPHLDGDIIEDMRARGDKAACGAWQHAFELNPQYAEAAAYALAQALRTSDPAAANLWLTKFEQLRTEKQRSDRAAELGNKAYAAMQQQLWSLASDTLQQAIAICGDCPIETDLHQRLGLAECHAGDLELGEEDSLTALKLKPNDRQTIDALRWVGEQRARSGIKE